MTDLAFDSALGTLLNQFSVPMFALDRTSSNGAFRFICINRALEASSNRPAEKVLGKTVFQLMPRSEADIVHRRYLQCVDARSDLRFRDRFTTAGKSVIWDTTLQHVALPERGDRVVGTCIQIPEEDGLHAKEPALDDIQYYSAMADLQLQNLISTFEIFRDRDLFSIRNEQHIDKLTGMCRTVQRAVADIKKVVHDTSGKTAVCKTSHAHRPRQKDRAGSDTIGALFSDVAEDLRRFN